MRLPSDDHPEWTALPRYFAGELSEAESVHIQQWIEADPARVAAVAELRRVWDVTGQPRHRWDAAAGLQRIKEARAESAVVPIRVPRPAPQVSPFQRRPWWKSGGVAAAIVLAAVGGWWFIAERTPQASYVAPPMTELVTRRGQRADLLLPDGSRVTLGVGSRLRYPTRYAGASRDLYLDGEAYFQVAHDPAKPFRVHTARGIAEDLGTAFGVRAYGADELEVVVAEGAVVLRNLPEGTAARDSAVLRQADYGVVDRAGRVSRTSNVDVDAYLAWRQGKLVFHDTPVREVLRRLSRWYDIDLEIADSTVAERPFTASFDNEPAERVLDVLALTMRLRYERRGSLRLVYSR